MAENNGKQQKRLPGSVVVPFTAGGQAVRVELVRDSSGGGPAVLSDTGRGARVYLGRIVTGGRISDHYVVFKFQARRDARPASGGAAAGAPHSARERAWFRELEQYGRLSEVSRGFTPLYFVEGAEPADDAESSSGSAARADGLDAEPVPPLIECREKGVLFQALDEWGQPLRTCRDETLLRENGLPPYEGSADTFLYNESAVRQGKSPVFYQPPDLENTAFPRARRFQDFLKSQGRIPGLSGRGVQTLRNKAEVTNFARLCRDFPCLTCDIQESCYPEEKFLERLVPFSFEESHAMVMELNQFHYDEFVDALGGISWKDFESRYVTERTGAGTVLRFEGAREWIDTARRYMYRRDRTGMDALEVFKLKWALFTQACEAVRDFHRVCRVPHLRLEPSHLMVRVGEIGDMLPTSWQFAARLISLGAPEIRLHGAGGEGESMPSPPMNSMPVYEADILSSGCFGAAQQGAVEITAVEEGEDGSALLRLNVSHEGLRAPWLSLQDRIVVTLRRCQGLPDECPLVCRRDRTWDYDRSTLILVCDSPPAVRDCLDGYKALAGERLNGVEFRVYPRLHVPCDVYSMGMMLFRTLTVNDDQGMGAVAEALSHLRADLRDIDPSRYSEGEEARFLRGLLQGKDSKVDDEIFSRDQIFFQPREGGRKRPNAIPKSIWAEAMVLGLQMITQIENFSPCANHGDYDPEAPESRMHWAVRRAHEIAARIDSVLLSGSQRNMEIRAAIDSALRSGF